MISLWTILVRIVRRRVENYFFPEKYLVSCWKWKLGKQRVQPSKFLPGLWYGPTCVDGCNRQWLGIYLETKIFCHNAKNICIAPPAGRTASQVDCWRQEYQLITLRGGKVWPELENIWSFQMTPATATKNYDSSFFLELIIWLVCFWQVMLLYVVL